MAKSLNRVDLLGYLGTDAKIKEIADGTSVGEVPVATDYSVKDASGKWTERTEWHSVVIWGAASASEVLVKGARVHQTGRLRTRSWEKDGERRHKTEVVCDARDVIVMALPKDGTKPAPESASARDDDGIPFYGGHILWNRLGQRGVSGKLPSRRGNGMPVRAPPPPPAALGAILVAEGYACLATEISALRRMVPWAGSAVSVTAVLVAAFWLSELGTLTAFGLPVPELAQVAVYSVFGIAPVGWLLAECVLLAHACAPQRDAAEAAGGIFALSTAGNVLGALLTTFVLLRFLGTAAAALALVAGLLLAAAIASRRGLPRS